MDTMFVKVDMTTVFDLEDSRMISEIYEEELIEIGAEVFALYSVKFFARVSFN